MTMKFLSKRISKKVGIALPLLLLSTQAYGGGAYIYEMANPSDVATAGAGLAAKAQNASTVFSNPAGMTRIKAPELFAGASFMYLNAPFESDVTTTVEGRDGNASEVFAGGGVAYVHPLGEDWTLGISVQNYWGLALFWPGDWVGRYQATSEWLIAPQIQPSVAYKVNDWLSLGAGAGLTVAYLEAKAKIYNSNTGTDGRFKYDDTDFTVQGNFGLMIEPNDNTRIGVRYLTESRVEFSSDISTSGIPPLLEAGVRSEGGLDINMYIPQSLNVSAFHQINEKWAILGSLGWEDWSRFGAIQIGFDDIGTKNENLEAKDIYHFGIGGQYRWNPELLISFGFSYDSELFDDEDRSIILPLAEMYRYGTGFTYDMHENFTLGAAVDLIWEGDVPVKQASSAGGDVSGEYQSVWFLFPSIYGIWRF